MIVNSRISLSCGDPRIFSTATPRRISPRISTYRSRMIESQIDEICASVTDVPPSSAVVDVKRPAISWSFTNAA